MSPGLVTVPEQCSGSGVTLCKSWVTRDRGLMKQEIQALKGTSRDRRIEERTVDTRQWCDS